MKLSLWQIWNRRSAGKHLSILRNERHFSTFDANRSVESYEFAVFDTELTGLSSHRDEIVSIAAIRIKGMQISLDDSFHSLVRTRKRLIGEGIFVHRITPEQILQAPKPDEILPKFVDFCGDSVLVGHLPALDFAFFNKACHRALGGVMRSPCLDSMELAQAHRRLHKKQKREALPGIRSLNLTELSVTYGLPLFTQHDALGDALQTACLFLYLVERLKGLGLQKFKDFYRIGRVR